MRGGNTGARRRRGPRIAIGMLTLALMAAVGCGDGSDSDSGSGSGGDAAHVGKRLAIIQSLTEGYNIQVACGATSEGRRLGFEVESPQGPKTFDPARQVQIANAVLAKNPDALVFLPSDPKSALQAVRPAVSDGLKIAAIDTNLEDPSAVSVFIASDHEAGGRLAGEELLREIGGRGKVLVSSLVPDHPITKGRVGGFESVIKSSDGVEYLGARYPEIDIAKVAADTAAILRKHPDIAAIYTTNNISTPGVITALRDAGLAGRVKVVTWDYDEVGAKYLESGEVTGLIAQHPREMGEIAARELANALDGRPVRRTVSPPITVINDENKDDPEVRQLRYANSC
jgi:ribose transport system substrate-binding protein